MRRNYKVLLFYTRSHKLFKVFHKGNKSERENFCSPVLEACRVPKWSLIYFATDFAGNVNKNFVNFRLEIVALFWLPANFANKTDPKYRPIKDTGRLAKSRPHGLLSERSESCGLQSCRTWSLAILNRTKDYFESLILLRHLLYKNVETEPWKARGSN